MTQNNVIDIERIMQMIPHRYPFLLVDKVINVVKGESCTGIKNVTINENFFLGHFPQKPVMPGVLIVESMAQTSGILVVDSLGKNAEGKLVYFMSIEGAKFRKPVGPGDVLKINCKVLQGRRNVYKLACEAKVDEAIVAEATVTAMIVDGQ
jgi:3-hydroxyacyl-[acyl-carrier-protein] dehydratase